MFTHSLPSEYAFISRVPTVHQQDKMAHTPTLGPSLLTHHHRENAHKVICAVVSFESSINFPIDGSF